MKFFPDEYIPNNKDLDILKAKLSAALKTEEYMGGYSSESNPYIRIAAKLISDCTTLDEIYAIIVGCSSLVYSANDDKYHTHTSKYDYWELLSGTDFGNFLDQQAQAQKDVSRPVSFMTGDTSLPDLQIKEVRLISYTPPEKHIYLNTFRKVSEFILRDPRGYDGIQHMPIVCEAAKGLDLERSTAPPLQQ